VIWRYLAVFLLVWAAVVGALILGAKI